MKTQKHIKIFALALTGVALMQTGAKAGTVAANQGDLILAFRDPSGQSAGNNLMVDLGAPINFINFASANPGVSVSMNFGTFGSGFTSFFGTASSTGLAAADLTTSYTSSWASLANPLSWSVAGTDGNSTAYITFGGTPANRLLTAAMNTLNGKLNTEEGALNGATSLSSPGAANLTAPYSIAIRNGNPGTFVKDYNALSQVSESSILSSGSTHMDLWTMAPGSGTPTGAADIGTFTLGSNGTMTFTAAGSVPEPSTLGLMALAGAGWLGMMRRRSVLA